MNDTVSEFIRWWSSPRSSPQFRQRFIQPIRYRHGSGMENEDAVRLAGRSPGYEDVVIVSESEGDGGSQVELLCVDPITGLRHRVRFEIVTDGSMIASVVEHSEIVDDDRRAPLQPMTTNDQHEMLVDSVRLAASSAEQQRAARRDSDLATKHLTMNFQIMYLAVPHLEKAGRLSPTSVLALTRLHDFLRTMPADAEPQEALDTHPFWAEVRRLSADALRALGTLQT